MSIEKLLERIRAEARAEAAAVLAEADDWAKRETGRLERLARTEAGEALARRKEEISRRHEREIVIERLALRRRILARKQEIFSEIRRDFLAGPARELSFLEAFAGRVLAGLSPGDYRLESSPALSEMFAGPRWEKLSAALAAAGVRIDYRGAGLEDGIRLHGERFEIVVSPAKMLGLRAAEVEAVLARHIFPDPGEAGKGS